MTENQIIEQLNNLHSKILRSPFSKNVTESEIMALIESKKAIEEFKALKEKSVAKPRLLQEGRYYCPTCGGTADMGYCKACGQNLY